MSVGIRAIPVRSGARFGRRQASVGHEKREKTNGKQIRTRQKKFARRRIGEQIYLLGDLDRPEYVTKKKPCS